MPSIDSLVTDFLAQKVWAVSGVRRTTEDAANLAFQRLKAAGYTAYPINPNTDTFQGGRCYPDLRALPETPGALFIVNKPAITLGLVEQCAALGVKRVWMHCSLGTNPRVAPALSSASEEALRLCRENGIAVIPGACLNMFLQPDGAHAFMRGLLRVFGGLKVG